MRKIKIFYQIFPLSLYCCGNRNLPSAFFPKGFHQSKKNAQFYFNIFHFFAAKYCEFYIFLRYTLLREFIRKNWE